MFNGIVETIGRIEHIHVSEACKQLTIAPQQHFNDLNIGDSIAINGVCLTITALHLHQFDATAVPETLRLTNLQDLKLGDDVNVERSLLANSRIGGHYVQGHVDAVGKIIRLQPEGEALLATIRLPSALAKYVVNKGYIALDGMSITVIEAGVDYFTVTFIPHTQKATITHQYQEGSAINIEVDIFGKYIERLLTHAPQLAARTLAMGIAQGGRTLEHTDAMNINSEALYHVIPHKTR